MGRPRAVSDRGGNESDVRSRGGGVHDRVGGRQRVTAQHRDLG
ncbi:hypothetical protein NJ7G_0569 [Natrinema sp. J7-2]|nr:hypothetical protein NJ7G_0569 [Natrinema sp. J7-2]